MFYVKPPRKNIFGPQNPIPKTLSLVFPAFSQVLVTLGNTFLHFWTCLGEEIHWYLAERHSISINFMLKFTVFEGKKTKIWKIHIRFFKIQIGANEPGLLSESEHITPPELREKSEKRNLFFLSKKNRSDVEHDFAL